MDNCGVPTYLVNLKEIATAYLRLASEEHFASNLICKYARYACGDGALATMLIKKYSVIAKTSINCLIAIGFLTKKIGIAIKASSWKCLMQTAEEVITFIESRIS